MIRMQQELQTKYGEYQEKAATWPDAIRQQKERSFKHLIKAFKNLVKLYKWT